MLLLKLALLMIIVIGVYSDCGTDPIAPGVSFSDCDHAENSICAGLCLQVNKTIAASCSAGIWSYSDVCIKVVPAKLSFWDENESYFWIAINMMIVILIAIIVYYLIARIIKFARVRSKLAAPVAGILKSFTRWVCAIVCILVCFAEVNLLQDVWTAIIAILALIAVGFVAVWSVMSNLFAALLILVTAPFEPNDIIAIHDGVNYIEGRVVDFSYMSTTLDTGEGDQLNIPNNFFFQKLMKRKKHILKPKERAISLWEQLNIDIDDEEEAKTLIEAKTPTKTPVDSFEKEL